MCMCCSAKDRNSWRIGHVREGGQHSEPQVRNHAGTRGARVYLLVPQQRTSSQLRPKARGHSFRAAWTRYHGQCRRVFSSQITINTLQSSLTARLLQVGNLIIYNPRREDSGNYSCAPSNLDSASVVLHVLSGESTAPYIVRLFTCGSPSKREAYLLEQVRTSRNC